MEVKLRPLRINQRVLLARKGQRQGAREKQSKHPARGKARRVAPSTTSATVAAHDLYAA
jgi:hypothetical protein